MLGYDGLQIPIVTTADTTGAHQQAEALKGVTDETKQLQAALEKMAVAQEEATRAQRSSAEESNRMAERGKRLAAATEARENKKYAAQADKEIAEGVKVVGQEEVKAAEAAARASEKAFLSKKQWKDAVKGLANEFPVLGHLGMLAINPITAAVALGASAWAIWKYRVDELAESMSRLKLPDLGQQSVSRIHATAEAYERLNTAVKNAVEKYNSVDEASNRHLTRLREELELEKQLLAANKARDLATLESRRGSMSDLEYNKRREVVERNYAGAGLRAEQTEAARELEAKETKRQELVASARKKEAEAAKIKLPSEADKGREADLQKEFDAQKAAAQEALQQSRARLLEIGDMQGAPAWKQPYQALRFRSRYGYGTTYDQAREMEQGNISNAQAVIDRSNERDRQKAERDRLGQRREMLRSQAEAEAAQAAEIGLSLPEERRRLAERQRNQNRVAQTDERTRLLGLSADQASSPLGQNLLRAAGLANGVATRQIRYGSLSRDDQEFLRSMDRGLTGDRTGGDMNRALRTFAGLDRSPERFSQVFNRASAVGQVKEDAATAQALATGRSASDTSKNALAEHTRLLTGIEQTMERMIKLNEHAADSRDTINARIAALERRLVNQDSRLRDSYNR